MVHGWEQQLVLQQHARQRRCRERRGREHHELDDALAIGATVVTGMLGGEYAFWGGGGGGVGGGGVAVRREVIFTASAIEV